MLISSFNRNILKLLVAASLGLGAASMATAQAQDTRAGDVANQLRYPLWSESNRNNKVSRDHLFNELTSSRFSSTRLTIDINNSRDRMFGELTFIPIDDMNTDVAYWVTPTTTPSVVYSMTHRKVVVSGIAMVESKPWPHAKVDVSVELSGGFSNAGTATTGKNGAYSVSILAPARIVRVTVSPEDSCSTGNDSDCLVPINMTGLGTVTAAFSGPGMGTRPADSTGVGSIVESDQSQTQDETTELGVFGDPVGTTIAYGNADFGPMSAQTLAAHPTCVIYANGRRALVQGALLKASPSGSAATAVVQLDDRQSQGEHYLVHAGSGGFFALDVSVPSDVSAAFVTDGTQLLGMGVCTRPDVSPAPGLGMGVCTRPDVAPAPGLGMGGVAMSPTNSASAPSAPSAPSALF